MGFETKISNGKLENTNLTPQKPQYVFGIKKSIQVVITNFVWLQMEELVKFGISRSITDFNRDAIKEKINRHKYLLSDKFLTPKERKAFKKNRRDLRKAQLKDEE